MCCHLKKVPVSLSDLHSHAYTDKQGQCAYRGVGLQSVRWPAARGLLPARSGFSGAIRKEQAGVQDEQGSQLLLGGAQTQQPSIICRSKQKEPQRLKVWIQPQIFCWANIKTKPALSFSQRVCVLSAPVLLDGGRGRLTSRVPEWRNREAFTLMEKTSDSLAKISMISPVHSTAIWGKNREKK